MCVIINKGVTKNPRETKNKIEKISRSGRVSLKIAWFSCVFEITTPAKKAPKAAEIPNNVTRAAVPKASVIARRIRSSWLFVAAIKWVK